MQVMTKGERDAMVTDEQLELTMMARLRIAVLKDFGARDGEIERIKKAIDDYAEFCKVINARYSPGERYTEFDSRRATKLHNALAVLAMPEGKDRDIELAEMLMLLLHEYGNAKPV